MRKHFWKWANPFFASPEKLQKSESYRTLSICQISLVKKNRAIWPIRRHKRCILVQAMSPVWRVKLCFPTKGRFSTLRKKSTPRFKNVFALGASDNSGHICTEKSFKSWERIGSGAVEYHMTFTSRVAGLRKHDFFCNVDISLTTDLYRQHKLQKFLQVPNFTIHTTWNTQHFAQVTNCDYKLTHSSKKGIYY